VKGSFTEQKFSFNSKSLPIGTENSSHEHSMLTKIGTNIVAQDVDVTLFISINSCLTSDTDVITYQQHLFFNPSSIQEN
jgi:chemotaxis receptor (MCP) glutamine deamidase CheD